MMMMMMMMMIVTMIMATMLQPRSTAQHCASGVEFYCGTSGWLFPDVPCNATTMLDLNDAATAAAAAAIAAAERVPVASAPPPQQFTNSGLRGATHIYVFNT